MSLKDLNLENQNYIKKELSKSNSWMSYQIDDILKRPDLNIILHGCNCFHVMNSGISYKISQTYLETSVIDKQTPCGDSSKLGTFSAAMEKNINSDNPLLIINLYSIFRSGNPIEEPTSLDSKENRFLHLKESLNKFAEFIKLFYLDAPEDKRSKYNIGVPWLINCGSIGCDYNQVFELFRNIFSSMTKEVKIIFIDNN